MGWLVCCCLLGVTWCRLLGFVVGFGGGWVLFGCWGWLLNFWMNFRIGLGVEDWSLDSLFLVCLLFVVGYCSELVGCCCVVATSSLITPVFHWYFILGLVVFLSLLTSLSSLLFTLVFLLVIFLSLNFLSHIHFHTL